MSMKIPQILSESEEGFADLVFAITASGVTASGGPCFDAEAVHEGTRVGLRLELPSEWSPREVGGIGCFSGVVTYRSLGELSDRFVATLDRLYGVGLNPSRMNDGVRFDALTLGDDPRSLDAGMVHIKLFFESEDEDRYAEVYTNIDLPGRKVQIREKDGGYRRAIVQALAESDD
jgi:hypothetical protein